MSDSNRYPSLNTNSRQTIDQMHLETRSINHQYVEKNEDSSIVARYLKTVFHSVSFLRPKEDKDIVDGMLRTSVDSSWFPGSSVRWRYEDEVIVLYDNESKKAFERLNKKLLNEGVLREYDENVEYVWASRQTGATSYEYALVENITPIQLPSPTTKRIKNVSKLKKGS